MRFLSFLRENARWIAGGFLLTFFSTIGQTSFIALSAGHIRTAFELSHGAWGTIYMIGTLASALTLPHLGQLVDRYGVRQLVCFIVPMLGLAAALLALAHHIAVLLLAVYLLRLFGQGMMTHTAYTATARWFSAQRGKALSLVVLGHNAGDAVFPITFVTLVGLVGWRNGWLAAAAALILIALPLAAMLVAVDRTPRASDPTARVVDAPDWTRAQVLRDPIFYLAMTGIMAPGFIVTSIWFHQVYLVDLRGWSLEVFASAFIITAVVNSFFTIASGQLIDRYSGVALLPFVLLPLGVACIVLGLVEASWAIVALMVLMGISNGLSTTLFGAVWPEIYGLKHLGSIRALAVSAGVFASAAGPGLTGYLIDFGVSLPAQFIAMGFYCGAASLVLLYVSRRVRARNSLALATG